MNPQYNLEQRFLRNKDLIKQGMLDGPVAIIGLGGIGSFVLQTLTMMGVKEIIGFDADIMESHNVSSTCYPLDYIGKPKTEAAKALHKMYSDETQIFGTRYENYTRRTETFPQMIVCTDNMESRKVVWENFSNPEHWIDDNFQDCLFIDARMGATSVELVSINPSRRQQQWWQPSEGEENPYLKHWQPTNTVPEAPCSMKHTVFAAQHIASLVVSQYYNMLANLAYYDYIWTSLSPNTVEFGTLITPEIKEE